MWAYLVDLAPDGVLFALPSRFVFVGHLHVAVKQGQPHKLTLERLEGIALLAGQVNLR